MIRVRTVWLPAAPNGGAAAFIRAHSGIYYEQTQDEAIRKEAEARLALLEPEKHFTGNHDLGFMIFCSFGNAYRITGNPFVQTYH
jgi:hypothetical protein